MSDLKNCPCCDGRARIMWCDGAGRYVTSSTIENPVVYGRELRHRLIQCSKCGLKTKAYATIRGAFNAWNRRTNDFYNSLKTGKTANEVFDNE